MGDDGDKESLKGIKDYLESELTSEWSRKTSFETRLFSLVTANVAVATLFLAFSDRLDELDRMSTGRLRTIALVALIASVLSVVSALYGARPQRVSTSAPADIKALVDKVDAGPVPPEVVLAEVIDVRLVQLEQAQTANDRRGRAVFASYVLLALAGLLLAISVVLAHQSPA